MVAIRRQGTRFLLSLFLLLQSCGDEAVPSQPPAVDGSVEVDTLRVNQLQFIGSHNSYRLRTPAKLLSLLLQLKPLLPAGFDPNQLDYSHLPVDQQLEGFGVRSLELDIYHDPEGGRFYKRKGNALVGDPVDSGIPELLETGSKLLHIPDVDYATNYPKFLQALLAVQSWSKAHPNHFPLFILVELKDDSLDANLPGLGFTKALPWDAAALNGLEQEIGSVFPESAGKIFRPDDLRGNAATLSAAVASYGWPTVGQMRGRVVFTLFASTEQQAAYLQGHPALQGRLMFFFSEPGKPEAAIVRFDDPIADFEKIRSAVLAGYIVRTRADDGTAEARSGDASRREKALLSGAHLICTDYYRADARAGTPGWSDYTVQFKDSAPGRIHPFLGPTSRQGAPVFENEP